MASPRIGLIARADNSGLGSLAQSFARNMDVEKILIVQNGVFQPFPDRFSQPLKRIVSAKATISQEDMDWFLDGVDLILSFETFYNFQIVHEAKKKGVKTVLMTMCELFPLRPQAVPDLYICPSALDMDMVPGNKVYLPPPMEMDRLPEREVFHVKHLVHTASHGGVSLRKGTPLLLEAMKHVRSDVKLTIYSWIPFECEDPRVEIKIANFQNYWQLWREGDALVYPQDVNGICLPVAEAYASGMVVISTDIYPFNLWLSKEGLFKPSGMRKRTFGSSFREVDAAIIEPKEIALKIDELAAMDVSKLSKEGREWGKAHSWKVWKPKYLEVFEKLCQN